MGHAGVAKAIRPVHTLFDGDVVYAMATGEIDVDDPIRQTLVGNLAVDCVARAITRAVYNAGPHPNVLGWKEVHKE